MTFAKGVGSTLDQVTGALKGGEDRPGQREMAEAVAAAVARRRHLVVQAGTGTGKSLAYLVPVIRSGRTTVIATATKALQDQLAGKDLPFLQEHLDEPFTFAVLKGRGNYVCLQRLHEATTSDQQLGLTLDEGDRRRKGLDAELTELALWAASTESGDRAELDREPSSLAWATISVGPRECPGASKCPQGESCFAEKARAKAMKADVVVVNLHLYGLHLAAGAGQASRGPAGGLSGLEPEPLGAGDADDPDDPDDTEAETGARGGPAERTFDGGLGGGTGGGGGILPEHDIVVIDEAHQFEDTISASSGLELGAGRFSSLARTTAAIIADADLPANLERSADSLVDALGENLGRRLRGALHVDLQAALMMGRQRVDAVVAALRAIDGKGSSDVNARKQRAMQSASSLAEDISAVLALGEGQVAWVEGYADAPVLKVAPLDVAPVLRASLWNGPTVILTSATIPAGIAERLGLDEDDHDELDVGSPFDYATNAILYCAAHIPDPRSAQFDEEVSRELERLIVAAGGRTLALFTSFRAMDLAVETLRPRLPWKVLSQRDLPKPALVRTFQDDEESCLFATMSFWQGVDIPGPALSLVTIDRLPFPRPDEPLLQARREIARADAFRTVDLPRATTLLAQGAGRLIRRGDDRGVVAVLDPRLATNARYRWDIIRALPPMKRTKDRAEAETFLRALRDERAGGSPVPEAVGPRAAPA